MAQVQGLMRRPGNRGRVLLIALGVILLLLLCLLLISQCYSPPEPPFVANPGGPYIVDENQPLTLNCSDSTGATIPDCRWDFSDSNNCSGMPPTYICKDGPAQITATLTITDTQGRTASAATQITVNNLPPTAEAGGPYTCHINQTIQLSGGCNDPSPIDQASLTCAWADFSGAAVTAPMYTCPANPGEVTVTLTATDKDGASAQDSAPVTVITGTTLIADANGPYTGPVNSPISFNGSGSRPDNLPESSYRWEFGDGQSGQGIVTSHPYTMAGTYPVTLTMFDSYGQTAVDTTTATITDNKPPIAIIRPPQLCDKSGLCYHFDGSDSYDPDGGIVDYAWNFGDNPHIETGPVVDHVYSPPPPISYTVTLTVTDDKGATGSVTMPITIYSY